MNRVILAGNVGQDPVLRMANNGNAILSFRMATTEKRGAGDDRKEFTEWHSVTMFGTRAEALARHLSRGDKVLIEGELRSREWDKDGQKHRATEVIAHNLEFIGGPKQGGQQRQQRPAPQQRGFDLERDTPTKEVDPGDDFFRS